jgi:uncharacterized protein (TIGR04551 family)
MRPRLSSPLFSSRSLVRAALAAFVTAAPTVAFAGSAAEGDGKKPIDPPAKAEETKAEKTPEPALAEAKDDTKAADAKAEAAEKEAAKRSKPWDANPVGRDPGQVFSEDWWSHTRPVLELHGYFRTRGELFHNFALGRHNSPTDAQNLWPQPLDHSYVDEKGVTRTVNLCDSNGKLAACEDKSQASANMRLRLEPELHISDNLRVMAQIDALDNLVLGSTPNSYGLGVGGKYVPNPYAPTSGFSDTQGPPTAGVNSYRNSIDVKRAWAEYTTPVGQLRFGRMPTHWGLGMVWNAGAGIDQDWQSNNDRIMFTSGVRSLDLFFGGSWDFVGTGPTSADAYSVYGGQPYNLANRTNVGQWNLFVAKKASPDVERLRLAKGNIVINGGLFNTLRTQELDVATNSTPLTFQSTAADNGLEHRGLTQAMHDAWFQLLYKKFRLEAEGALVYGNVASTPLRTDLTDKTSILQGGFALESDYRAMEDKLKIGFGGGWASGDPWSNSLVPGPNGTKSGFQDSLNGGKGPLSTFRFNPAYNIDLILHRRLLNRVQGTYYFRPSVDYDFVRNPNGQRIGGGAAAIWTRSSQYVQAPGNARDLGVELDFQLYYQAKDGTLNDDPKKLGGFYAMLQYGALFPLGGLDYVKGDLQNVTDSSTSIAQTVRLHLGVVY